MRTLILGLLFCAVAWVPQVHASEGGGFMRHVKVDVADKAALQRGARDFVNYCMGCHSLSYVRYLQLEKPLGLSQDDIKKYLIFNGVKVGDPMVSSMPAALAAKWFGKAPPDLTDEVRVRGTDWLYTYLTGFYLDKARPTGVNNVVFPNVGMPDVVENLQGAQVPEYKEITAPDGTKEKVIVGLKQVSPGSMTPEQYHHWVRDIVTFLAWTAEPNKLEREHLGVWIVLLMILFSVVAYFLKKAYWEDIH